MIRAIYNHTDSVYEIIDEDSGIQKILTQLTGDDAVRVVKELYSLGLEFDMPTNDSYIEGELQATKLHLADLRRLVMDGIAPEAKK